MLQCKEVSALSGTCLCTDVVNAVEASIHQRYDDIPGIVREHKEVRDVVWVQ